MWHEKGKSRLAIQHNFGEAKKIFLSKISCVVIWVYGKTDDGK